METQGRFTPDPTDPQWLAFEKYLEGELLASYRKLANAATTPAETEQARGRAAFITKLLSLKTGPIVFTNPPTEY